MSIEAIANWVAISALAVAIVIAVLQVRAQLQLAREERTAHMRREVYSQFIEVFHRMLHQKEDFRSELSRCFDDVSLVAGDGVAKCSGALAKKLVEGSAMGKLPVSHIENELDELLYEMRRELTGSSPSKSDWAQMRSRFYSLPKQLK